MNGPTPSGLAAWHADDEVLGRYATATIDVARAASVEQHLLACAHCRARLAVVVGADRQASDELDVLWRDVLDVVDRPRLGLVGELLRRLGCSDRAAMVVAATPALRASWMVSIVLALAFAVAMASTDGAGGGVLLVLAPLIPLVGIATAYGAGADPLHELVRAAPLPGSRVFLYRSIAVLVTALPLAAIGSLWLPADGWAALAWLLPALGLVGLTLALSTWVEPRTAAMIAGVGWIAALTVSWLRSARFDGVRVPLADSTVFSAGGQVAFSVLALAGVVVFVLRLERFDTPASIDVRGR